MLLLLLWFEGEDGEDGVLLNVVVDLKGDGGITSPESSSILGFLLKGLPILDMFSRLL